LLKELAKKVDVLVENFAAAVMERLGLGYNVLRPLNPRLIYTTVETSLYDAAVGALLGLKPTELAVLQRYHLRGGDWPGTTKAPLIEQQ
jgi:crotonobetainyl-CoA:carnitine CoA-transferase CaiB-like acyl-CoA transferase